MLYVLPYLLLLFYVYLCLYFRMAVFSVQTAVARYAPGRTRQWGGVSMLDHSIAHKKQTNRKQCNFCECLNAFIILKDQEMLEKRSLINFYSYISVTLSMLLIIFLVS